MTGSLGYLIVSGRWDDNVAVVDLDAALLAENDGTDRAVVSRPRVTPDLDLDGDGFAETRASGQPVAVAIDSRRGLSARASRARHHAGHRRSERPSQ